MSSVADIIRQFLIDRGYGVASVSGAWPVFVSFLPNDPDNALCVYDTAGKLNGRIMSTGEQVEHPGIQVMVRGPRYADVIKKAIDIAKTFDSQKGTLVVLPGGSSYILSNISRSGAIVPLGIEEEGDRRRHLVTINAMVTVKPVVD